MGPFLHHDFPPSCSSRSFGGSFAVAYGNINVSRRPTTDVPVRAPSQPTQATQGGRLRRECLVSCILYRYPRAHPSTTPTTRFGTQVPESVYPMLNAPFEAAVRLRSVRALVTYGGQAAPVALWNPPRRRRPEVPRSPPAPQPSYAPGSAFVPRRF